MPPSFFSPDTTWTGTQILLSEQHWAPCGAFFANLRGGGIPHFIVTESLYCVNALSCPGWDAVTNIDSWSLFVTRSLP